MLKKSESTWNSFKRQRIDNYILDIVFATRYPEQYGLQNLIPSYTRTELHLVPSINLALAAKAKAFMEHRAFVLP